MYLKFYRFVMILMAMVASLPALPQDKDLKTADELFKDLQYQEAIALYTKTWSKMKEQSFKKQQVEYKLAECYRLTGKPAKAAEWYGRIADSKFPEKYPDVLLHYADALRSTGNCDKAILYYRKFIDKQPDSPLGISGVSSCEELFTSDRQSRFIVGNLKTINSTEDDYAATFSSGNFDQLFFSSNRKGSVGKDRENWSGAWFSDIYMSNFRNSAWEPPVTADATGILNTEANEGTPFFDQKFSKLYFTRCEKGADKKVYCQIMESDRQGQRWTKPKVVLSDANANSGQPWVSHDELVIFFASDRKGGQGGKDIWMASRSNKGRPFGEPVNLGPTINTAGDEMFPLLKNDTLLYFASSGHPGFGGLDIFRSVKTNDSWANPENLLTPINSSGDDFAINFKSEKEGYFSSNRDGGLGRDDIYYFVRRTNLFTLSGTVKDERTLFTTADVSASLISSLGDTIKVMTDKQGFYSYDHPILTEDNDYHLILAKENFFTVHHDISTFGYTSNHDFVFNTLLKPIPEEPIILPDILYDLAKWDIKPQYQDSLMVLVKILRDNPNLIIELRSHTDSRASLEYNDELSQKRAQSVVDFLVSKGVEPDRLVAKGYGERVPRALDRDFVRKGYTFRKGVTLTEPFIENLSTNELKESAHELNRRTEFLVIAKDYKPSGKTIAGMPEIRIIADSLGMAVAYTLSADNDREVDAYLNNFRASAMLDQHNVISYISEQQVIELMRQGGLSKLNFEGDAEEILKDNQVREGAVIRVEKFRIGDKTLDGIRLTVRKGPVSSLMLGQDILDKFGEYEIDDIKKQIIFK